MVIFCVPISIPEISKGKKPVSISNNCSDANFDDYRKLFRITTRGVLFLFFYFFGSL
jgi:hypothetical protein